MPATRKIQRVVMILWVVMILYVLQLLLHQDPIEQSLQRSANAHQIRKRGGPRIGRGGTPDLQEKESLPLQGREILIPQDVRAHGPLSEVKTQNHRPGDVIASLLIEEEKAPLSAETEEMTAAGTGKMTGIETKIGEIKGLMTKIPEVEDKLNHNLVQRLLKSCVS